jgi:hypothetical protein
MVFLLGYELLQSTCLALMDTLASCYDLYSWLVGMISLEDGYDILAFVVLVSLLGCYDFPARGCCAMVSIFGRLAWSP